MMRKLRFRVIKKNGPIVVGDATTFQQLWVDMDTLRIVHIRSDAPNTIDDLRPLYDRKDLPRMVFLQTGKDEDLEVYEEIPEGGRVAAEVTPEVVNVQIP